MYLICKQINLYKDIWGVHTKNILPMDSLFKYFIDLWPTKMAESRNILENIK